MENGKREVGSGKYGEIPKAKLKQIPQLPGAKLRLPRLRFVYSVDPSN